MADGSELTVSAKFVFIGAGDSALPLLQASKIPEGKGYGGFPVSGIWRQIIPTYGIDLKQGAESCRKGRADTATVLKIEDV